MDVLPETGKNADSLMDEDLGLIMTHKKSKIIEKAYAVQVVLGRAVLRHHKYILDPVVGPLDPEGHKLSKHARNNLLKKAGRKMFGVPRFSEHTLRTYHVTMMVMRAIRKGVNPEHCPDFKKAVSEIRAGMKTAIRYYNLLKNGSLTEANNIYEVDFDSAADFAAHEGVGEVSNKKLKLDEGVEGGSSEKTEVGGGLQVFQGAQASSGGGARVGPQAPVVHEPQAVKVGAGVVSIWSQ